MSIKYKKKDWVVMTDETHTTYDHLVLPVWEKVTLTIMRRVTEAERKKSHEDKSKFGRGVYITYEELKKLQ